MFSSSAFDLRRHIIGHTMAMTRLDAAPIILLQTTTKALPRPPRKHAVIQSTNSHPAVMEPMHVTINHHIFSRYECEIACALQLYIKNANNQKPSDDTLGFIIKSLRGEINGEPLPCQKMVRIIQHYGVEAVRAIYLSVRIHNTPLSLRVVNTRVGLL